MTEANTSDETADAMRPTRRRCIRGFGVFSFAKVSGMLSLLLGLVSGILVGLGASIGAIAAGANGDAEQIGGMLFLAVASVIGLPIAGLLAGFFGGLLVGLFFNLACRMAGGIEIDLE